MSSIVTDWRTGPLVAILAVLALTLPFINQPFNQDDRDFIQFARASASDITRISIHDYSYDGRFFRNFRNPHAPVLTTYLGLLLRAGAPESETLFHLAYLFFPLTGALSMFFLARRFTRHPLAATLLLVFTPAFLVTSHLLMDNLPGMSLSLLALALYIAGADRDDIRLLALAGAALIVAVLTAYQSLAIMPIMALYAFLGPSRKMRRFVPFALLAAGGAAWLMAAWKAYGRLPAVSYRLRGQDYDWPGFFNGGIDPRAILVALAGAGVFPLAVLAGLVRSLKGLLVTAAAAAAVTAWTLYSSPVARDGSLLQLVLVVLLALAGLVVVYRLVARGTRFFLPGGRQRAARDDLFLLGWFACGLAFYLLVLVPYVSARHLMLLFPPMIILFVNELEELRPRRLRALLLGCALGLTLAMGLAAAVADYRSASVYPELAAQLGQRFGQPGETSGRVYFRGEFGFRYYLEQQGFEELNDRSQPKPGDLIIFSSLASPSIAWPEASYSEAGRLEPADVFPFRVWNSWAGAGFYTNRMGPLPLALSDSMQDQIIIYQVNAP